MESRYNNNYDEIHRNNILKWESQFLIQSLNTNIGLKELEEYEYIRKSHA